MRQLTIPAKGVQMSIQLLASEYERHFEVVRASTPALLQKAYRLRYQVYCVERPFEDPEQQIDGCETDKYDDRSVHTLLIHRKTGEVAGTSRIILPRKGEPLPIATLLGGAELHKLVEFPFARTGEISRFAVSKQFRQRCSEDRCADIGFGSNNGTHESGERRLMPHITLGLLKGMFDICLDYNITHLAAVMEPALIRIVSRLGLEFRAIGGLVEHHGQRQPCIAQISDLVERSREREGLVWQYAGSPTLAAKDNRRAIA